MRYRSGLEERVAAYLEKENIPFLYEAESWEYQLSCKYKPDFITQSGLVLESKGFFPPSCRRKHLALQAQQPDLEVRFIFQRNNTLSKKSKTRYGDWCDKHGFKWCVFPNIPPNWFQ